MAEMRPVDPSFVGAGKRAERALYEALAAELPEGWFVYYGLPYFDLRKGYRQGEIDFLLLHREHGMLVIECKGTGVRYDREHGCWYRLEEGGRESRLDAAPLEQARRHRHDLVRFLEEQIPVRLPEVRRFPFVHDSAVAFPLCGRLPQATAPEMPPHLLITADDLPRLEEKVTGILAARRAALSAPPRPLTRAQFRTFRKHVLRPAFRLAAGLGGQAAADDRVLVRLTESQARLVLTFLDNPVVQVRGGAGTGKTVLAVEAATRLAADGAAVLLLCYNRFLGRDLAARFDRASFDRGQVVATHFHGLCERAYAALGRRFSPPEAGSAPPEAVARFWNEEAPLVLWEALEARRIGPFDALVVDEAQDFLTGWWEVLAAGLRGPAAAGAATQGAAAGEAAAGPRQIFFYDPAQDIFGRQTVLPEGMRFTLPDTFRSTRAITEQVNALGFPRLEPHLSCPAGAPVTVVPQGSPAETRRALDALVRRLTGPEGFHPEQIAILTPRTRPHTSLAPVDALGGYPLGDDPHHRVGRILHTTVGRFKGLESDVVILLDVDPAHPRSGREVRYCGASRARHLLYIFCRGDWAA